MGADQNDRSKDAPQLLGATAFKPVERHGFDIIKYMVYNKETGEFFTRTPKSWLLITIFYTIYYCCLAAFWYGMLQLFFMTMPLDKPKYQLEENIIGVNPGVGMRPSQPDITIDSSMLVLDADAKSQRPSEDFETASNIDWAKRYEKYLNTFKNMSEIRECDDSAAGQEGMEACKFDVSALGDCAQFPYGYLVADGEDTVAPCVLLKVNRIFNWNPKPYEPEFFEEDEDKEDPIPESIKDLIRANQKNMYVNCEGENPADIEALDGKITYFPEDRGINFKYFPYNHAHKNYHNPLVAVKFNNLPKGQLVHVECKLWSRDLVHNRKDKVGGMRFEIMLE